MLRSSILSATALLASGGLAQAHDFYVRGDAGVRAFGGLSGEVGVDEFVVGGEIDLEPGLAAGAASGVAFDNGVRIELEGRYLSGDLETENTIFDGVDSDARALAVFTNLYYDFKGARRVEPFIGAGIGVQNTRFEFSKDGEEVSDDLTGFAIQGIYGAAFPISKHVSFDLAYRFIYTPDLSEDGDIVLFDGEGEPVDSTPYSIDLDRMDHVVSAGVRYRF